MVGIVEGVGRGLIDRRRPRAGDRVRPRAGVDRQRLHAVFVLRRGLGGLHLEGLHLVHALSGLARFAETIRELMPLQLSSPESRANSILGQRFMTTVSPASSASCAA